MSNEEQAAQVLIKWLQDTFGKGAQIEITTPQFKLIGGLNLCR